MRAFGPFSAKDVRTAARILNLMIKKDMGVVDLFELSQKLSKIGAMGKDVRIKKRKRTPEEKALRKKMLAEAKYGKIKP